MSLLLGKWENSHMVIGTAYFDASGKKESQALVVAGFLAPIDQWIKFEKDWKYCLAWYGKSELHMKDFAHSAGEYESWKGNEPLRRRFLSDLIRVIKECSTNSLAMAIHMSDYDTVNRKYQLMEWAHPYAFAGIHLLGAVKSWAIENEYDISSIDYVFEAGDEGKGDLFRLSSSILGIDPIFKPNEYSVAFQAADLIAYEHYRANLRLLDDQPMVGIEDFRIPFQLLAGIPGSAEWGILQEKDIERVCVRHKISLR